MVRAAAPKLAEHTTEDPDHDNGATTAVAELPTTTKKPRKKVAGTPAAAEQQPAEVTTIPVEEVAVVEVEPTTVEADTPTEPTTTSHPDVDGILAELRELEAAVATAEARWDAAKRAAKDAHEIFDARVADLRFAIQSLNNDSDRPLFAQHIDAATEKPWGLDDRARLAGGSEGVPFDWRLAPVGDLKLPAKLVEKLADNSITTVGELEDVRANPGLSSIKGIGPAKVTLIEDAVLAWLSIHRDAAAFAGATTVAEVVDAATAIVDASRNDEPSPTDEEPETPERRAHVDQVLARVDAIEAAPDYDASDRPEHPSPAWTAGYQYYLDYEKDGPECCPHGPGSDQDEWLRGWLYNDYLCGDTTGAA